MKEKLCAVSLGALFLGTPYIALADPTPAHMQIQHLTAIAATLRAQEVALKGGSLACAALVSKTNVRVDEPFAIAWGSVGALDPSDDLTRPLWAQNGAATVSLSKKGSWRYTFTFFGSLGNAVTCTADVSVSSAQ